MPLPPICCLQVYVLSDPFSQQLFLLYGMRNICRQIPSLQWIILNLTMYPIAPITTNPTPTAWLIFKNSLRSGFVQRFRKFWPSLRFQFSGAVFKEHGKLCRAYRRNSRGVSRTSLIMESDIAVCKEAGDKIPWCTCAKVVPQVCCRKRI